MLDFFKSFIGLKKFLSFKSDKKRIVFYSESHNYRKHFIELIINLKKSSNYEISYVTSDAKDLDFIGGDLKPVYIGNGFIRTVFFTILKCDILIMTLTNLGIHHLKKSKNCKNYVYIFHAIVSTHKCHEKEAFKNYDMIFTVAEFQKKELLEAEKIYKFPKKKIFTTGYFYFEHMLKNIKPNNTNPKNILFAPTWIRSKKNLFEDYSVSIIQLLLDYGYSVTLRTHPETFKRSKKTLKLIFQKFGDKKNFQLNTNLDNIDCFDKSKLLITDDGGVGMEYAYLYKKPIIYINYVKKIHNQFYKDLNIEPIEDKFKRECGYEIDVSKIKSLEEKIIEVDSTFKDKMKNIKSFYEKNGLNNINSSKIATNIIIENLNNKNDRN